MRMNLDGQWLGVLCEGLEGDEVGAPPVLGGSHCPCFPDGGHGPGGALCRRAGLWL